MDIVIVDGETKLKPVSTKDNTTRYSEIYFGWETGNFHEFPSELSAFDVAEAYREMVRATAVR